MTTSQIIACAIAWTAAIVAITAYIAAWSARRAAATKWHIRWNDGRGELTTQQPLTEAEYEALKAAWLREHGNTRAAHHVKVLQPTGEEEPDA